MASTPHFPGMRGRRLADIIIKYCTPAEETPEEFVTRNRFAMKWNDRDAEMHVRSEEARQTIADIMQVDDIELTPVEDPTLYEAFGIAESYERDLQTSLSYPVAIHLLKRLYTVREHLPKKVFVRNNHTGGHEFITILRRLVEDL
ncbi:MAG: hypothetical protein ACREGE_01965 [Candidatus Microsaccharimonas sp.]